MNDRLEKIASYIEPGLGFADVGTDHGYIPAALALAGYGGNIIASDINSGPLSAARATAEAAGVEGRIEFLLCDGLSLCDREKIDTIIIAGMGGDTICRILDEAEWVLDERYRLILQPMTKAEVLRYWLVNNGFEITAEDISPDGAALYQICVARFGGTTRLTDSELFTGKRELCRDSGLHARLTETVRRRIIKAIDGMESAGSGKNRARLGLYREILEEMER